MFKFGKAHARQPAPQDDPPTAGEERLRATEAALHATEAASREVLEQVADLVHLADRAGNLTYVNRTWQQTLGGSGGGGSTPSWPLVRAQPIMQRAIRRCTPVRRCRSRPPSTP